MEFWYHLKAVGIEAEPLSFSHNFSPSFQKIFQKTNATRVDNWLMQSVKSHTASTDSATRIENAGSER